MAWFLLAVVALLALALLGRWRATAQREREASTALDRLSARLVALEAQLARLARFEQVADADDAARVLLADARRESERLRAEALAIQRDSEVAASALKRNAEEEARAIREEARNKATIVSGNADIRLREAESRASQILAEANAKAEAIAGDALKALREVGSLERSIQAIENRINGYGDRYIVPTYTLLDGLADHFGHAEAGQKLKFIREEIRAAVLRGASATCDYVEDNRRTTAIRFVTDAFNGKADSILARVRDDNFGTLHQELKDAFAVVNQNGKAFRNACIVDTYMALREEELRWATVAQGLKEGERDEQRRVKDELREEEKVRRECERALRETAREEEVLKKAMAKAHELLARATDEQKAKYEGQLEELQARLQAAEAKGQRALSMAQQTKRGNVYIISNVGSFGEHVYKIGLTRRLDPLERVRELGDSSVPFSFDVHATILAEDAPALETQLHRHFAIHQVNKINFRREFFRATLAEIRKEIESLGLETAWTMTAAAREYRETQSIERTIAEDPTARELWLKRQLTLEQTAHFDVAETEPAADVIEA